MGYVFFIQMTVLVSWPSCERLKLGTLDIRPEDHLFRL